MSKYLLLMLFACSILTPLSGVYAMLLAYIFLTLISLKDIVALVFILYAFFKIYKLRKVNAKN